ncbi:MAG TPA: AIR synthase-related protein, partial [Dehalococcoidia bacterium]|nr:AIR synthase-related protein [Dehalococcoidia bacterium]
GNPEKNDVFYQMKECIAGMARACRDFKIPVISGNVSLYNETMGEAVYPTPVVGMVGLIQDVSRYCTSAFKHKGDVALLLGDINPADGTLSGSEYMCLLHKQVRGNISIDLKLEKRLQRCCLEAVRRGLLNSAHDCSDGGLLVCLAESCIQGKIGLTCDEIKPSGRLDSMFFGEAQSRIVVSVSPQKAGKLLSLAQKLDVPVLKLGITGGDRLFIKDYLNVSLTRIGDAWLGGLIK